MPATRRRDDHTAATRASLVRSGRKLFATKGYADTSIEDICRSARVTRGALYYHFADKRELFAAIHEQLQAELADGVAALSLQETDPWRQLEVGCSEFLKACATPEIRRIVLQDAPSVLGWVEWREVDAKHGFGILQAALAAAMQAGVVEQMALEPLAHVLLAALNEAGLVVAHADDTDAARADMEAVLMRLVDGLRPGGASRTARPTQPAHARPSTRRR